MGLGRGHVQEALDPSRPEADVALRMDAAVDGFGRGMWAGGLCWEWGDAVSCLDGRSDNFTDNCGLVVVSCACSVQRAACGVRRAACGVRRAACGEAVGAFGMLKPDVFSGGPDRV